MHEIIKKTLKTIIKMKKCFKVIEDKEKKIFIMKSLNDLYKDVRKFNYTGVWDFFYISTLITMHFTNISFILSDRISKNIKYKGDVIKID